MKSASLQPQPPSKAAPSTVFHNACIGIPSVVATYYQVERTHRTKGWNNLLPLLGPKRRHLVRWIFGTSNVNPLPVAPNGFRAIGADCRGVEHEIALYWVEVSGLFELWVDGHPKAIQENSAITAASSIQYVLDIPNGQSVSGFCEIKVMVDQPKASFFQSRTKLPTFELEVDGQRFSNMIKIYQLGLTDREIQQDLEDTFRGFRQVPIRTRASEERRMIAIAKKRSLKDAPKPWWHKLVRRLQRTNQRQRVWLLFCLLLVCKFAALIGARISNQGMIQLFQFLYASLLLFLAAQYVQELFAIDDKDDEKTRED